MKPFIFSALLTMLLFNACIAPSQIVDSWHDTSSQQNNTIHKVMVAAIIHDPLVRREVEDYMVSLYPGIATQSYTLFDQQPLDGDEEAYNNVLRNQGFDAVIIIHQTNEQTSTHYVPGQWPEYYQSWGRYWQNGWRVSYGPEDPGHFATNRTWIVQVTVYSILQNKLIWAASTSTTNPGGRLPLFEDVCKETSRKMKTDGLLN